MLEEFLDQVALDSGDRQAESGPSVQMMTLHSAKGLEFPLVFLDWYGRRSVSRIACRPKSPAVSRKSGDFATWASPAP